MKEAVGDLNSTVISVVAMAAFSVFFFNVVWPIIDQNIETNNQCSAAICDNCTSINGCDFVSCHHKGETETFECVYKG